MAAWFIRSGIYSSGGLVYNEIYASGGLVYTYWSMPVAAWFIHIEICQWRLGLYIVEYMPVAAWFIYILEYASVGLVYT